MLNDDFYGVGEALNETGADGQGLVIRGTQKFFMGKQNGHHSGK